MVKTKMKKISEIAQELETSPDMFLSQAVESFLQKELRKVQAEIYHLCGQYEVSKSSDIDEKYRKGELKEENSWEDYFKLDHLEYRRQRILSAMEKLNGPS
jgi:ABC-type phosphate/phosphonate transport system ATPase subunit